jgi:hypothetical protein
MRHHRTFGDGELALFKKHTPAGLAAESLLTVPTTAKDRWRGGDAGGDMAMWRLAPPHSV